MDFIVKTTFRVRRARVLSLLSMALGSGSCYQIVSPTMPPGINSAIHKDRFLESTLNGAGTPLVVNKAGTTEALCLDRAAIDRGLEEFAAKYPGYFADFMNEQENEIAAYVFLRCCHPKE